MHVGLLRAVNLPGHNKVAMRDLLDLLVGLGMKEPRTLLQSGNVVFRADGATPSQLERRLHEAAATRLGVETDVFVRTAKEWTAIIAKNPFPAEAKRDPGHLVMMVLKDAPERADVAALQKAIVGREVLRTNGREAFITYPDGMGRSRLTIALIERMLNTRGTARNWNTVLKLGALAGLP